MTRRRGRRKNAGMKTSQLLQVVLVSVFAAVPVMAASSAVGSDAPISLCGDKAEKAEKSESEKTDTTVKTEKKNDKKDAKDEKSATKGAA